MLIATRSRLLETAYMPSARRSLGRKDWSGAFLLCCSPSGAPHTLPPSPELLLLLKIVNNVSFSLENNSSTTNLVEGHPRETPDARADQVSPLLDLAKLL